MSENAEISVGSPVVVATSPVGERRWGYYQFPGIERWEDGTLCVRYHRAADAAESYGISPGYALSQDGGATWAPYMGDRGATGLLLPNGDRILIETPRPYSVADLELPEPVGVRIGTYGSMEYTLYDFGPFINSFHYLEAYKRGAELNFFTSSDGMTWTSSGVGTAGRYLTDGDWDGFACGDWLPDWSFSATPVTPVPEPMTLSLLGMGVLISIRKKIC